MNTTAGNRDEFNVRAYEVSRVSLGVIRSIVFGNIDTALEYAAKYTDCVIRSVSLVNGRVLNGRVIKAFG